jgi:iron complex transport system ATP-binding protein
MATHFPNHAFYFENQGIPVEVAFMDHQQVHPAGPPSRALTEENLARFYHVNTAVITHSRPGNGMFKYIVPINTLKNESDPLVPYSSSSIIKNKKIKQPFSQDCQ